MIRGCRRPLCRGHSHGIHDSTGVRELFSPVHAAAITGSVNIQYDAIMSGAKKPGSSIISISHDARHDNGLRPLQLAGNCWQFLVQAM